MNHGGRQIFDSGDDDVYLRVLGKSHRFRQSDFSSLDDSFIRENLHRIQLTTGSAGVATLIEIDDGVSSTPPSPDPQAKSRDAG